MSETYVGAVAPEGYQMVVEPGQSGLDLSTVSAASFKVLKPDNAELTWTAVLSAQSANSLTLSYAFPGTSPLDIAGPYRVYATLTTPDGVLRTKAVYLNVKPAYEVP